MAHFRVIKTERDGDHMLFYVEWLDGHISLGDSFDIWTTHHCYNFWVDKVDETNPRTQSVLHCSADFLRHLKPHERIPEMFAGKQVDTHDPEVSRRTAYYWSNTQGHG
jgi:hypothetical protein